MMPVTKEDYATLAHMIEQRGVGSLLHAMAVICGVRATEGEASKPKAAAHRKMRVSQKALLALAEFLQGIE